MSTTDELGGDCSLHQPDMRWVILDYEIRASWWAAWVGITCLQRLSGKYFAWKVRRKYARWVASKAEALRVKAHIDKDQRPLAAKGDS